MQIWADPRWQFRRRYSAMRSDERGALFRVLNDARGKGVTVLATPHQSIRGTFPTGELLSNNTFANGTTGWTSSGEVSGSVAERIYRGKRIGVTTAGNIIRTANTVTVTQYVPYVLRMMLMQGRGYSIPTRLVFRDNVAATLFSEISVASFGMRTFAAVPYVTDIHVSLTDGASSGIVAGDYIDIPYVSLSRCMLTDAGVNLLLQSDEFDTSWTATRASVDDQAAGTVAPDGTSTADSLIEDTSNNTHYITQSVTVSSSELDYCLAVAMKAGARTWGQLVLTGASGFASAYVNLSTGALGTVSVSTEWINPRAYVQSLGNGWYYCALVARKTGSATSIVGRVGLATGNGLNSYTGDGTSDIYLWRATLAQSSVPTRLVQTTTAATSGVSPSGSAMYVKGGPANLSGALLPGDWVEITTSSSSELVMVTAPLDLDAAGLGYLQFRPGLTGTVEDNAPIIVHEPFGRFRLFNGASYSNRWGTYADAEIELTEIYE